ncbi:PilZ domain-containing protein [Vibrio intestinalis]|uniref:PilZ domain-containing protein n=1 Tax=Vibrio intestinalis TaxID=2933291 RepID=UPI0021A436B0|nr:PilZ domain-containing protein [Vibrio intestinalis]
MNDLEQKRKYYRLRYPRRAMPIVRFHDELFHVSEVSEKGIRIVMNNLTTLYKGLSLSGTLSLNPDCKIPVEGSILRFDKNEVILYLNKGPSFKHMVQEQRHIRNKYPAYFARLRANAAA